MSTVVAGAVAGSSWDEAVMVGDVVTELRGRVAELEAQNARLRADKERLAARVKRLQARLEESRRAGKVKGKLRAQHASAKKR